MANKTKAYFVTAPIRYVRLDPENPDMGNGGKVDFSDVNGRFSVTVVLTEEQKAELLSNGCPEVALGYEQFKLDKEGNPTYQFKRDHTHKSWTDKETGGRVVLGAPDTFDMQKAMDAWKEAGTGNLRDHIVPWDFKEDGPIWNGSTAKVKYSVYEGKKGGIIRLESVAILALAEKPTQSAEDTSPEDAYF